MKIALVHDYLREYGGAERVVEALHEIWPEAPLYTSFVDWRALGVQAHRFRGWDIRTSPIADNWFIRKFHSPLRFLAPAIWKSLDLSGFDVVFSSSGWFMCRGVALNNPTNPTNKQIRQINETMNKWFNSNEKDGFRVKPGMTKNSREQLHICYIHHPPRNLYGYATGSTLQKYWPVRIYANLINFYLRHYDFATAQKVDYFIANSKETQRRVEKFYRRQSTVIYPPVESQKSKIKSQNLKSKGKSYYLSVGRLTYSKRVDLAIEAANILKLPLKIVGTGNEEAYLKTLAGPTVEFLGSVSDEQLDQLYAGAKALIFCALDEDFGMVPVEAEAAGVPVIALGQGGVLETVIDGKTGILFDKPETEELMKAVRKFEEVNAVKWAENCRDQANKFSKDKFKKDLKLFVEDKYHKFASS